MLCFCHENGAVQGLSFLPLLVITRIVCVLHPAAVLVWFYHFLFLVQGEETEGRRCQPEGRHEETKTGLVSLSAVVCLGIQLQWRTWYYTRHTIFCNSIQYIVRTLPPSCSRLFTPSKNTLIPKPRRRTHGTQGRPAKARPGRPNQGKTWPGKAWKGN